MYLYPTFIKCNTSASCDICNCVNFKDLFRKAEPKDIYMVVVPNTETSAYIHYLCETCLPNILRPINKALNANINASKAPEKHEIYGTGHIIERR